MSCELVRESVFEYVEDQLPETERVRVDVHLSECRACANELRRSSQFRQRMRSLPKVAPPPVLTARLQVLASREQLRRRWTGSLPGMFEYWTSRVQLLVDNLMRPLALPFAGGLTSAICLFGMLMPSLGFLRNETNDIPTALYTEASVENVADIGPQSKNNDDTLVEVSIDGQGRMIDYNVPQGQMTSELGNMILFATYTPARMFGQPAPGKIMIRRSRIVVKG
jgi:hypothetical protein